MFTLQSHSQYICLKFHIRDRVVEAKARSLLALGYCQSETITYARFTQKQHIPEDDIERAISGYVCPWFKYRSGGAGWPIRPWLWSLAHFNALLYIHMHGIGVPETSICRIYRSRRNDGGARARIEVVVFRDDSLGRVSHFKGRVSAFDRRRSLFVPIWKSVRCRPFGRHLTPMWPNRRWSCDATSSSITRVKCRSSHFAAGYQAWLTMPNWVN